MTTESPTCRYVLFLDGGKTTGWSLYDRQEDTVDVRQLSSWSETGYALEEWLAANGPATIVGAEKYVITPMSSRKDPEGYAIQVYGIARWQARRFDATYFVGGQRSSDALSFVPDAFLKRIGWYRPAFPHGNDASRHVVKFMADRRILPDHIRGKIVVD